MKIARFAATLLCWITFWFAEDHFHGTVPHVPFHIWDAYTLWALLAATAVLVAAYISLTPTPGGAG